MPDEIPVVRLIHAQPIEGQPGRERLVALSEGDAVIVASRPAGGDRAELELSFSIDEAISAAHLALGGHERARTMPGLTRILCASIIALSKAAFEAGALIRDDGVKHAASDGGGDDGEGDHDGQDG